MEKIATGLYSVDILILIAFQVLNRDFGPLPEAVSAYGSGRTAHLFKLYLLAGSIAAPLLAWQFWMARAPAYPAMISIYLGLVAVGRIGVAIYPLPAPDAPDSFARQMHHAATFLAFVSAYMAVVEATPQMAGRLEQGLPEMVEWLRHVVALGFMGVVLTATPLLRPYFGLAERVFLFATALWFLTASLTLPPL